MVPFDDVIMNSDIITFLQNGFRGRHLCESQIQTTFHHPMLSFDWKNLIDIAIIDLSKAFDTVSHERCLKKLVLYRKPGYQAFISLVDYRLEYSATVWDPFLAQDIDKVVMVGDGGGGGGGGG